MAGILYLHGFRSSPQSFKARAVGEAMVARGQGGDFFCPDLSHEPRRAMAQAEAILAARPDLTLVGSSLGGFYATWLAERYGRPAVLVNPAVVAHLTLSDYLGPQTHLYSGEVFEFTRDHVAQLQALEVARIDPTRYWLLVEEGDEVLDYRQAVARYAGARQTVLAGGDHSFTRFVEFVPQIIEFAGL